MALILKKKENVVVRFDGQKVSVCPIISYEDQLVLTELCANKFHADGENKVWTIPACKLVFDLGVLALQTDIPVNGFQKVPNGAQFNIDRDEIDYFVNSGILDKVFEKIENYGSTWNNIVLTLQNESLRYYIGEIGRGLPTVEEMSSAIQEMKSVIDDNPQFVEKVAKAKLGNDFVVPESKDIEPKATKSTKKKA